MKPLPDFKDLAIEMAKPNMNFMVLWEEYKQDNPDGYQYSQFCQLFGDYLEARKYSMRQIHKAGEKAFVDFGEGLSYMDMITGQEVKTRAFVFVWGASLMMFACCTPDEKVQSWVNAHTSAVEYFGCIISRFGYFAALFLVYMHISFFNSSDGHCYHLGSTPRASFWFSQLTSRYIFTNIIRI